MSRPFERLTGVNDCRVVTVVEVKSLAGEGTRESPAHEVTEYYSFEGELLARKTYRDRLELGIWAGHGADTPLPDTAPAPKDQGGSR